MSTRTLDSVDAVRQSARQMTNRPIVDQMILGVLLLGGPSDSHSLAQGTHRAGFTAHQRQCYARALISSRFPTRVQRLDRQVVATRRRSA
jgi:hypothetical protein